MKNPYPKKKPHVYRAFQYPIEKKIKLDRHAEPPTSRFLDVLLSRRSAKPKRSLSQNEVGEILLYSNRIEAFFEDESGFIQSLRVSPSSGARHPIDLLVCNLGVPEEGIMYYNPLDHSLNNLKLETVDLIHFMEDVQKNTEMHTGTLIWFAIQFEKTASKYENPESLYWRDLGALLYCIQLVSTFYNYKSCPIGSLVPGSFHKMMKSNDLISGGGILVGK